MQQKEKYILDLPVAVGMLFKCMFISLLLIGKALIEDIEILKEDGEVIITFKHSPNVRVD